MTGKEEVLGMSDGTKRVLPEGFEMDCGSIQTVRDSLCEARISNCPSVSCEGCMFDAPPEEFKAWLIKELGGEV